MTTNTTTEKKITLATIKSFIKKNRADLFINVESDFDSMTDCVESRNGGFVKAEQDKTDSINSDYNERTQGIKGAWFVGGSRDYFNLYDENGFIGYRCYNCCGSFVLAIAK